MWEVMLVTSCLAPTVLGFACFYMNYVLIKESINTNNELIEQILRLYIDILKMKSLLEKKLREDI